MPRLLKCRQCGLVDSYKEDMEKGKIGYYHKGKCYDEYANHQAFLDKESVELDSLYERIKSIYGLPAVPSSFVGQIQRLRNGTILLHGRWVKKYKSGVTYPVIEECYRLCEKEILRLRKTKNFANLSKELNYGLLVVSGHVVDVSLKMDKQNRIKEEVELHENIHNDESVEVKKPTYTKQKNKFDISDFLE